ncbi:unnamed protein product [Leptosia nina]|uniref:Odorant receptor n=1 Tax=Leptosia nina TaxID=320188 RepID=A0AAV1JI07_9NEOP
MVAGEINYALNKLITASSVVDFVAGLHIAGYDSMSFGKLLTLWYKRDTFKHLLIELADIWPMSEHDKGAIEIKRNKLSSLRIGQFWYAFWNILGLWLYNLTPIAIYLYHKIRGAPAYLDYIWHLSYPFDKTKPVYHEIVFVFELYGATFITADECDIDCSNVYDPVCGKAMALGGTVVVKRFHNICYFNKIQCRFGFTELHQIPDEVCKIGRSIGIGRRVNDFSVVGAHQACNHTCPTFCLDTYDPACAQIWSQNMQTYTYRPMINHCHIDLFSCVMGVNVTIQPLIGKCYKNPTALMFMFHIASLKTLKLLDEPPAVTHAKLTVPAVPKRRSGGSYIDDDENEDFVRLITKIY